MKSTTPTFKSLHELYVSELRDLYSAEKQLTKALPKMAEAANSKELKKAIESHLKETEGHVSRLEEIFETMDEKPTGETCEAMKGLIEEGERHIKAKGPEAVVDAGIIGAAQRVEHYEIAAYGTARTLAEHLGEEQAAKLLQQTLEEEGEADKKLTSIAEETVNQEAASTSR